VGWTEEVESFVSLEYPKGRTYEATLIGATPLRPGQEFVLHGRRWRAVEPSRKRRRPKEPQRMVCVDVTPVPATDG
jgi:hypothetical protein